MDDVYIAVMGVTGAGKSRFISECTKQPVKIGESLVSCTTEVDDYAFAWKDKNVHLIDTPGFDDTHRSDFEVLEGIAGWMGTAYTNDIKLSGILYLHRITDNRMTGAGLRNLTMFKKLCGEDFYPRVFLVTTMWDKVSKEEAKRREKELRQNSDFWETMIQGGANLERHWNTRDSAMDILREAIRNRKVDAPAVLKIQKETVDQNLQLNETAAGQHFETELLQQRKKYEQEMKKMQQDIKELLEMNQLKAAQETERQMKHFEERIAQGYDDQVKLRATIQNIQEQHAGELVRMQERVERDRQLYEEKIQRLERAQNELGQTDPSSAKSHELIQEIEQSKAEISDMSQKLGTQQKRIQQKIKRFFVKSKDWARQNPQLATAVAEHGMNFIAFGAKAAS